MSASPESTQPLRLGDLMTRNVVSVDLDDTMKKIHDIFDSSKFHHVVVTEEHKVVGVISDRDVLRNLSPFFGNVWMERPQDRNLFKRKAHQIMRRQPVVADEDMPVAEAAWLLLEKKVTCLPVVTPDRRLCGIVTWRDLLPHCFDCKRTDAA